MIGNRQDKGLNGQQQTGQRVERAATRLNELQQGRDEGSCRAFADGFCHVVELQALASLYRQSFVVMLPRGEDEQLATGTGFHALATGFCEVGETVFL